MPLLCILTLSCSFRAIQGEASPDIGLDPACLAHMLVALSSQHMSVAPCKGQASESWGCSELGLTLGPALTLCRSPKLYDGIYAAPDQLSVVAATLSLACRRNSIASMSQSAHPRGQGGFQAKDGYRQLSFGWPSTAFKTKCFSICL